MFSMWILKHLEEERTFITKDIDENWLPSIGNSMLCGGLNGKEIQKRGVRCTPETDSLQCTAETYNTVKQLLSKKKKKKNQ